MRTIVTDANFAQSRDIVTGKILAVLMEAFFCWIVYRDFSTMSVSEWASRTSRDQAPVYFWFRVICDCVVALLFLFYTVVIVSLPDSYMQ